MHHITKIETKTVIGILDTSIQIFIKDKKNSLIEKRYVFIRFTSKDTTYKRIMSIYKVFRKINNCKK